MTTANFTTPSTTTETDFLSKFWNRLQATKESATCPKCEATGLEVRKGASHGKTYRYVLCCGSAQPIIWSEQEIKQLEAKRAAMGA